VIAAFYFNYDIFSYAIVWQDMIVWLFFFCTPNNFLIKKSGRGIQIFYSVRGSGVVKVFEK
jgi:hypothetical protein